MSKYERVLKADYTPPGVVDNKGGGIIDGRMIMIGSVGADKISIKELSDLIQAMGTLRTGTIHLGQSERSFLRLTSEPVPRLELRDPQGRYVTVLDANPSNGVTVAMGLPDANGVHPFRIPVGGDVEIRTRAIVGMNSTARTFIDAGMIDLLATGTTSWDAADATAIRLKADWGIASKEAGVQNVKWDAQTGKLLVGQWEQVQLQRYGLVIDDDKSGYSGVYWTTASASKALAFPGWDTIPGGATFAFIGADHPSSWPYNTELAIAVSGTSTTRSYSRLWLYAAPYDGANYPAQIILQSGPGDSVRTPGIYLYPPSGYPVTVRSDLVATGSISSSGAISGDIQAQTWPYSYDPPDSEARLGRLLVHILEGTRYRLWIGRGETNGWAYLDFTEA